MNNNRKIAIVSASLGTGGAERFAGLLSFMLTKLGFEVYHIIIEDQVDYEFSGQLYNLGILGKEKTGWRRKLRKGKLLKRYLDDNQIDCIIDNRSRNHFMRELFAQWSYGNRKKYVIVHSYHLENYFPKSTFLAKLLYKKASKIICVSKAIEQKIIKKYGFTNTQTIYNPIANCESNEVSVLNFPENFILFYGRFEEKVKNFSLMLEAYAASKVYEDGYKLLLLGDGPDLGLITNKAIVLGIQEHVQLLPFMKNPFGCVKVAKFTILTSYYEGFPMSIIESLALGTPVVSVDCNSGPREVIQNEFNGLLIENHNIEVLATAINRMINDDELYQICKNNAVKSVEHLSLDSIGKQWQELLNQQ